MFKQNVFYKFFAGNPGTVSAFPSLVPCVGVPGRTENMRSTGRSITTYRSHNYVYLCSVQL